MGLVIGIFAGGFAAWYRRFLRSSQERAAGQPRAARSRSRRAKAKEQARADRRPLRQQKYADREARRKKDGSRSVQPIRRMPAWPSWRTPSGCSGPAALAADLDQWPDASRHQVDDARLDLQVALDVEQRVATDHAA